MRVKGLTEGKDPVGLAAASVYVASILLNEKRTQREVADKLGITEAAVSRYISGKRGAIEITDNGILKEIERSTERIAKKSSSCTVKEICKICTTLRSKGILCEMHKEVLPALRGRPCNCQCPLHISKQQMGE